jgi:hypothetical protein
MSSEYLSVIQPFAQQAISPEGVPAKKWRWVSSFDVYRSLLRLLDNPDAICQSCFGLCGQSAFLRCWAYRDPAAVARFCIDLYINGSAKIGDYDVSPNNDLLWCSWMHNPGFDANNNWGPGNRISEAVWMITGSLANVCDNLLASVAGSVVPGQPEEFDGYPASNLWTLSYPGDLTMYLQKTGCYTAVTDNTDVFDCLLHDPKQKSVVSDPFLTSAFTGKDDVILCLNSGMIYNAPQVIDLVTGLPADPTTLVPPPQFGVFPDHYAMLAAPITQTGGSLSVVLWTWGGYYRLNIPLDLFNSNYYGYIHAHCATTRRSPDLTPLPADAVHAPRIYYTQNGKLHFDWQSWGNRPEWFEILRVNPNTITCPMNSFLQIMPRDVLQRLLPSGPGGSYAIEMDMQDMIAPHSTPYQIAACHAAFKPYDSDSFAYNSYDSVPCNQRGGYVYSPLTCPMVEVDSTHFRLRYYDFSSENQIPTSYRQNAVETIARRGETAGRCYADGRVEITPPGSSPTLVLHEAGTPFYIQQAILWLEYFHYLLSRPPYGLFFAGASERITVTIGEGFSASFANNDAQIGIAPPNEAWDLPPVCLKALFSLDNAQWGRWSPWALPPYISRAAVVQVLSPAGSVPDPARYADYGPVLRPCEWAVEYDACWSLTQWRRVLTVNKADALDPRRAAVAFFKFDHGVFEPGSVALTLNGVDSGSAPISLNVPLAFHSGGGFYYGSFQPANTGPAAYPLKLEIQAQRLYSSSILKSLLGDGIDANPQSIAIPDPNIKPTLAILNADPGADCSHTVQVGTLAQFAPATSLAPDALEGIQGNNSFAAASPVSLYVANFTQEPGVSHSDQKSFPLLSLHSPSDADYFDVSYQCPAYDDTDNANRPDFHGISSEWGIEITHTPPCLSFSVSAGDFRCLDMAAYKSDAFNRALVKSDPKSTGITIDSPTPVLGAKRGYFVAQNHDFAAQGAFAYSVQVTYTTSCDSVSVDTNAPGYFRGTIQRQLLGELYARTDLPRPNDDWAGVIQVEDPERFVHGFEQFLTDPEVGSLIERTHPKTGRVALARGLRFLAQMAQAAGRYEDSEHLYQSSASTYTACGQRGCAAWTLDRLAGQYTLLGETDKLGAVRRQIRELRVR